MPTNVVKTPEQEQKWEEAKKAAEKAGQKDNYAYIMGVYKKMGGLEKSSEEWNNVVEKLAANYFSKLIGTNITKATKDVDRLASEIARRNAKYKSIQQAGKFAGKKIKINKMDINNGLAKHRNALKKAKQNLKDQQKETYKTRRNTLLGGGLAVGVGLGVKKKIDNYSAMNYGQTNYGQTAYASVEDSQIEKQAAVKEIAANILSGVKKVNPKAIVDKVKGVNVGKELKDAATFKTYRSMSKDFKKLEPDGNPIGTHFTNKPEFDGISNARYNMDYYKKQSEKADKVIKNLTPNEDNIDRFDNMVAEHRNKILRTVDDIKAGKGGKIPQNPATAKKWSDTTRKFKAEKDFNDAAYEAHKKRHDAIYSEALRKKDVALSKGLGLYGSAAGIIGGTAYGIHKRKPTRLEKEEGL